MRSASVLALFVPLLGAWGQDAPLPEPLSFMAAGEGEFGPRYLLEGVAVRGNRKTDDAVILGELGIARGDVVAAADPRVDAAQMRLLSLGYFLSVRLSLEKGQQRGRAVLVVEVQERGTLIVNAIHLGSSEATTLWGGLDLAETNFLGRGLSLGGGFVQSTRPEVVGAEPAFGFSARVAGPPRREWGLSLSGQFLYSKGNEFFRASGDPESSAPAGFVAVETRRVGGGLGVGTELSRTTRVLAEGRFESIEAELPLLRTQDVGGGRREAIDFGIHEGGSRLATLAVILDFDRRSDPVMPSHGGRLVFSAETALPPLASGYSFAKGVVQGSLYLSGWRDHVVGLHGLGGAVFGDAPYFDLFFVGDLNALLPPRALGMNFSTQPSRNFLGTGVAAHRYDHYAARALAEYAVPLWRGRHGFIYRGEAFVGFGGFAMASEDDLRVRDTNLWSAVGVDLTADLGLRLDTYVGIFRLSIANAIGRIPF